MFVLILAQRTRQNHSPQPFEQKYLHLNLEMLFQNNNLVAGSSHLLNFAVCALLKASLGRASQPYAFEIPAY